VSDGPDASDDPVIPPSRRLFLKGTGLAVGAAWATPALLSFASPAAAASTAAFVAIGAPTNSIGRAAVVDKPERGEFMVLVAAATGPLALTGDGWTDFMVAGPSAPRLYAWFGTAKTTDPTLTPSDDTGFTAAILSFNGATVANAGTSQDDTDRGGTVTAPAFNPRALGSFVFLGGTILDRTWSTPAGGYTARLDSRFDPDLYVATLNANATSVRLTTSELSDDGNTDRRGVHLSVS